MKKKDWCSFDKVFVSRSTKLYGRDGEIFIGGKGGRLIATQDDFGRKPKTKKEWEEKERQAQAMHEHVMRILAKEKGFNN